MRLLLPALLALLMVTPSVAKSQKEYKEIRSYIKAGSNLDKALQIVEQCKKDSQFLNDPELYRLAALVEKKRNEAQNTKLYLKQSYDTAVFFSSIYGMFEYSLAWDDKECIPDSKGRIRPRSREKIHAVLQKQYSNLFAGGLYYMKKRNYSEANKMFSLYLDAADHGVFLADSLQKTDPRRSRAAFWSLVCSFEQQDFEGVFKYSELARQDSANQDLCLQYEVIACRQLERTEQMVETLREGIDLVPDNHYFFSNLIDYYNEQSDYASGLELCQRMVEHDSTAMLFRFAEGVILFNLERYDECIDQMLHVQSRDTTFVEADFYIASCYYNKAVDIEKAVTADLTASEFVDMRNRTQEFYKKALPYMESYRALCPDDSARWGMPLYKMYLALNEAKKFKEIEALIN